MALVVATANDSAIQRIITTVRNQRACWVALVLMALVVVDAMKSTIQRLIAPIRNSMGFETF